MFLLGEDLPPPIGVGDRDLFVAAEALVGRDVVIHWLVRQATHQLWTWSVVLSVGQCLLHHGPETRQHDP
jgi:hypothetical protein